jgi:hypothetical protein
MSWSHIVSKFSFLELLGAVFSRELLILFAPEPHIRTRESRP